MAYSQQSLNILAYRTSSCSRKVIFTWPWNGDMIQQGHKIRFLINCSHSQCIVFSKFSISWLTQSREISELWFLCCHLGTHIKYKNKEIYHLRVKVGSDLGVLILIINQFLEIIRHVNWIRNYFDCQINVTLITLPEINSPNRVPEAAWSPVLPALDYPPMFP